MFPTRMSLLIASFLLVSFGVGADPASAAPSDAALSVVRIADAEMGGVIDAYDRFAVAVEYLGDVNGNGYPDVAVGARGDDDGGNYAGAVYLLSLDTDGSLVPGSEVKLSMATEPTILTYGAAAEFGNAVVLLGDYDGDGFVELAVGATQGKEAGAPNESGQVWILDVDPSDFSLDSAFTIGSGSTNFASLDAGDHLGRGLELLDDWDGDGMPELAVGAAFDDDGSSTDNGAVYILSLNPPNEPPIVAAGPNAVAQTNVATSLAGSVTDDGVLPLTISWSQLSGPVGGTASFGDASSPTSTVSFDVAGTYELELRADDTVFDLADTVALAIDDPIPGSPPVADPPADPVPPGPYDAVGIQGYTKISATSGGFGGAMTSGRFGFSVAAIGDLDGDGQEDLAVGAPADGGQVGSVFILFMHPDCALGVGSCSVASETEITEDVGGFDQGLNGIEWFGVDLDGPPSIGGLFPSRLAVGAHATGYGGPDRGSAFLLSLKSDGTVSDTQRFSSGFNGMTALANYARFGIGVAQGDVNGDAQPDLLVGTYTEDLGGNFEQGALRTLILDPCPKVLTNTRIYHSPNDDGTDTCVPVQLGSELYPTLHLYIDSGDLVTLNPADVCVDGVGEGDEICGFQLALALDGYEAVSFTPAISGAVTNSAAFPSSEFKLAWVPSAATVGPIKLGDLALAKTLGGGASVTVEVGSSAVDAQLLLEQVADGPIALPEPGGLGGLVAGLAALALLARRRTARARRVLLGLAATALLLPNPPAQAGTSIKSYAVIDPPAGAQGSGSGLAAIGDLDGDGVQDLMSGSPGNYSNCGIGPYGENWLHFLDRDGSVVGSEGPIRNLVTNDLGYGMGAVGDLDGDGRQEVGVGTRICGGSTTNTEGSLVVLSFEADGSEKSRLRIGQGGGGFGGTLDPGDSFGRSVAHLGDIDGDGNDEIAVGANGDDDGGSNAGAVWILSLTAPGGTVAWEQKISATEGGFAGSVDGNDLFGTWVANAGDIDGNGVPDLAVAAPGRSHPTANAHDYGAAWILFLGSTGPGNVSVIAQQEISVFEGGFAGTPGYQEFIPGAGRRLGFGMAWQSIPNGGGRGILYLGSDQVSIRNYDNPLYALYVDTDGTVITSYVIMETNGVGWAPGANAIEGLGYSIASIGDLDGDEVSDIAVGAAESNNNSGRVIVFFMQDSDHDGLDDNLDNCPFDHNPLQEDGDGDRVGDLCDNCLDDANPVNTVATDCNGDLDTLDPGEAEGEQCDVDDDGEGDVCEPVEIQLVTTGTPAIPSWDIQLECGAHDVTSLNGAIVLPAGLSANPVLTLTATSIGSSSVSGPGLVTPAGVRDDAIYFQLDGNGTPDNRLCTALDPPLLLGSLACDPLPGSCAIGGTQLAAAALSAEGVGTPGFGLDVAETAGGAVPLTDLRLANGVPLPILDLALGPAVNTGSGTRWDVLLSNASDEFHRVAFGLIAPFGTGTGDMRWVGCEGTPNGNGERTCSGGSGFGATVNAGQSWTVGPQASPPGTQLPHTLYVVLEGNRSSQASLDTLNPANAQGSIVLGTVELSGSPDLEPALTNDGVNDIADYYGAGSVAPFEESDFDLPDPTQVKLIGAFNPADDVDADGVQDLGDICPFVPDPAQTNGGSFLDSSDDSDFLGDACQCGEGTGDGAVFSADVDEIFDLLAGNITNPVIAADVRERCSVVGTTECNIRDVVFLMQAIAAADPSVDTRCDAALSPAQ